MIPVQISHYKFSLREPYVAGQTITAAEAEVLNGARIARLRSVIYRMLQRRSSNSIMSLDEFEKFSAQVQQADLDFKFDGQRAKPASSWTIQDELEVVARERAENAMRQLGMMPEEHENELAVQIQNNRQQQSVKEEAERRFALRQKAAAEALAELL